MTDIWFVGDPHGEFQTIRLALQTNPVPDAIVLLGDFDVEEPLERALDFLPESIEIHFIHGNHDCDRVNWYQNLFESALASHNLHGKIVDVAGAKIAGLGGVFRDKVWYPKDNAGVRPKYLTREEMTNFTPKHQRFKHSVQRKHHASIFPEDLDRLCGQADILVTHEAPSTHRHGFAAIDALAVKLNVQAIFHGHHHQNYTGHIDTDIRVEGLSLAGIKNLEGRQLIVGKKS